MYQKAKTPKLHCADGTTLSVQTGEHMYCYPRSNTGPWTHVEFGYPSVVPGPLIMEYCEDRDNPTRTVYGYVPIEYVLFYIGAHGGLLDEQSK